MNTGNNIKEEREAMRHRITHDTDKTEQRTYESSTSGYLNDSFEGISAVFTDREVLASSQTHVVARAKRYGRWWVLKGLQGEAARQEVYRQRQRKEFEILMQLQHPGIVSVSGLEATDETGTCIVMEYVDGVTLGAWLKGKPARKERLRIARQLAEAVEYVHSKGIVHRDLKPENIIVTHNGEQTKLIDFGLADTDSHAVLKQPAGTPHYISPEQMQATAADVRNDIYSLGVIFSQMDLGYGRIVRKCLLPAGQRYANMTALRAAMQAHDRRPVRMAVWAAVVVVASLCTISVVQTRNLQEMKSKYEELATARTQIEDTLHARYAALNSTMQNMANSQTEQGQHLQEVAAEHREQTSARKRVEEAIHKGQAVLDRTLKETKVVQTMDTLSCQLYLPADFYDRVNKVHNALKAYIGGICPSFSERECSEITTALYEYDARMTTPLMERLLNKPTLPEE